MTFRQQKFLRGIENLQEPAESPEPKPQVNPIPSIRRSRLFVNLPASLNGGKVGMEWRRLATKAIDAPVLQVHQDKLINSKKPDSLATWAGIEADIQEKNSLIKLPEISSMS